jgi:predicted nuclease with TOPRIM domain
MHLRDNHIDYLLTMIDTWEPDVFGGLTWGRVLERFKKKHESAPTERTLRNQGRLKARFNDKKEQLRSGNVQISRKPASLARAAGTIQKLEARVKALEEENERIFHRLVVWQKNAMDHGMTKAQLERPLIINKDTLRNLRDPEN